MMAQYQRIKEQHRDTLLFYRMGDFYELFFDDAVTASEALDIVLTKRGKKLDQDIPMCGVPAHSADGYLQTLIRKGYRVAVCEQMEDPATARRRGRKAIVARDVVRVLTAGTLTEDELLEARAHNYLAAAANVRGGAAVAWTDISVGKLHVMPCSEESLAAHVARISPREILISESADDATRSSAAEADGSLMELSPVHFDSVSAHRRLCELFGVSTLDAFGSFTRAELGALGALVSYLDVTQKGKRPLLQPPVRERADATMQMDAATRRNLEISRDFSGRRDASLLGAIDRTLTAGGARLLELRVSAPSAVAEVIAARHQAVACFAARPELRRQVRERLRRIPDLNRSLSRLSLDRGGPRDLSALRNGLAAAEEIGALLRRNELAAETAAEESTLPPRLIGTDAIAASVAASAAKLTGLQELHDVLQSAVVSEPPPFLRDGGFVCAGYDRELDEERQLRDAGRSLVSAMQPEFAEETGISSLKVKHNNVLGYFVEVPSSHSLKMLAPPFSDKFVHRQSVSGAIRFTTNRLADAESRILNSAGRVAEIEQNIFADLCALVGGKAAEISQTAAGLAEIDVASSLAELAVEMNWRCPEIDNSGILDIRGGPSSGCGTISPKRRRPSVHRQ